MPALTDSTVCYVTPHYASVADGSSVRSVAVARQLNEVCRKLHVVTPDTRERSLEKQMELPKSDGTISLHYMSGSEHYRRNFSSRVIHEMKIAVSLFRTLRHLRPDVIITSYPPAFTPVPSLLVAKVLQGTAVLEVRDLMAGALIASRYSPNAFLSKTALLYERFLFRRANAVAIVSPGMKNSILDADPHQAVLRAYNGIEDTMLNFQDVFDRPESEAFRTFRSNTGLAKGEEYVVYAGAMTQAYDISTIIQGFARADLGNFKLVLLGGGERRFEYESLVAARGLKNIVFHDFVPRNVALEVIHRATVAVHAFNSDPHWSYVLGNKVFDYIAVGTPVLFSGVGTTADLVRETHAGLVSTPGNPDSFAQALRELVHNPEAVCAPEHARKVVAREWARSFRTSQFIEELKIFLESKNA